MATTGILRSRRSAAQLHAIAGVEREIRANDPAVGRKYLRDFRDAYRSYEKVLTAGDVRDQIACAGIALIGDYHALPNSQRYVASLLRDPALHRRPLVVGLETIFSRDQHILDEWQRGEIDDAELRQRIRFDLDWGYDWAPFYDLLSAARDHSAAIYGLDCMPREDLRKIGARDRHAADKIASIRRLHPEALILVLFGESHLAPHHLPALVADRLVGSNPVAKPTLTVLQNVDALYWRAAGEVTDRVEAVAVNDHTLCVFNATPLEKYENYRLCLDRWGRDDDSPVDFGPTFYNLIDGLVRFLGMNRYSPHNTTQPRLLVDLMPEVYSRNSDALLRRLLSRKGFTAADRRSMLRRVRERGSVYLAPINALYVREFRMTSAAEEATRFLHQACRNLPHFANQKAPTPAISPDSSHGNSSSRSCSASTFSSVPSRPTLTEGDRFHAAVFEHALAFFGSRVLHLARPAFRDADLAELYDLTCEDLEHQTGLRFSDAIDVLDAITRLRDFDHSHDHSASHATDDRAVKGSSAASDALLHVLAFTGDKYEFIAEQLGYLIGNDLYDAYVQGHMTPAALRKLFLAHIDEPGVACDILATLQAKLK